MTTRADLTETAYDALDGLLQHAQIKRRAAELILDAVLPQITTAEQLEALPHQTIVIGTHHDPHEVDTDYQRRVYRGIHGTFFDAADMIRQEGPLTVVWQPQPEQETRA